MKIAIIGPPSSGKGTQAIRLAQEYGLPHISTGDMLREEVERESELGKEAESFMSQGQLVPDDLVIRMMAGRLSQDDAAGGFVLDGYPRTLEQAEALDRDTGLDVVLYIDVTDEEIIRRATGRRICSKCGAIYHVLFSPPKSDEVCDACGGRLKTRRDDTETVVRERLEVFERITAPLTEHYHDILVRIDGNGTPEETSGQAKIALAEFGNNV